MAKENVNGKKDVSKIKEIKLNLNYVDFIKKVSEKNLLSSSKEVLIEEYLKDVKVKSYRNIKRVSDRVKREELTKLLEKELVARKMELSKFIEIDSGVVSKLTEKEKNYVKIEN